MCRIGVWAGRMLSSILDLVAYLLFHQRKALCPFWGKSIKPITKALGTPGASTQAARLSPPAHDRLSEFL